MKDTHDMDRGNFFHVVSIFKNQLSKYCEKKIRHSTPVKQIFSTY